MIRAAVVSYPMLFQTQGGLQIQILESIKALKNTGIDARLIDTNKEKLVDFDIVHVFAAINGNQRVVERAKSLGLPTVCSPLIQPHWNHSLGNRGRLLDRLVGWMTDWEIKTEYRQIESCLKNSDLLLALGDTERRSIVEAFRVSAERIRVVPNGIPERFFSAAPELAYSRLKDRQSFILCVASINSHKNQLSLAKATASSGRRLLLVGQCLPSDEYYLAELLTFPHVTYLGKLEYDDPLLASLYVAAEAFCLTSHSEVMPLCVLEALASGTPVVMTRNHSMDVSEFGEVLLEVNPQDESEIKSSLDKLLVQQHSASACRNAVRGFTWDATAKLIHDAYLEVLGGKKANE